MRRLLLLFTCVGLQLIPQAATAQTPCGYNPDANGDLLIGTTDLLSILNLWSETDSDGDCVWDGEDDCFGSYDACGVCNGPGPTIEVVDEILFATDSVFLEPIQQWYVFTYATDTLFTYLCPVPGCTDASALNFNPLAVRTATGTRYRGVWTTVSGWRRLRVPKPFMRTTLRTWHPMGGSTIGTPQAMRGGCVRRDFTCRPTRTGRS